MHESEEDKYARLTSRREYIVSVTEEHTASFIVGSFEEVSFRRAHLNFYNRFLGFSLSYRTFYLFDISTPNIN